jgi:hypothetical protein
MTEKLIDDKLVRGVKALGGIALKMICLSFTGLPDRTVLLPGGRVCFAELKTTGKKPSPRQVTVIAFLRKLGFTVYVIDDQAGLDNFFNEITI